LNDAIGAEEVAALAHAARLFGDLFLFELGAAELARLQETELREALLGLGVAVPDFDGSTPEGARALDELAAKYYAALISPTGGAPPIASLWLEGRYSGETTARLGDLAALAGFEYDGAAARSAPVDHLGSVLRLWAEAAERAPAVADVVASEHLAWADRPLARIAAGQGFYAELAAAARELVEALASTRLAGEG
jgi:TorA maturation chaperone TorD